MSSTGFLNITDVCMFRQSCIQDFYIWGQSLLNLDNLGPMLMKGANALNWQKILQKCWGICPICMFKDAMMEKDVSVHPLYWPRCSSAYDVVLKSVTDTTCHRCICTIITIWHKVQQFHFLRAMMRNCHIGWGFLIPYRQAIWDSFSSPQMLR